MKKLMFLVIMILLVNCSLTQEVVKEENKQEFKLILNKSISGASIKLFKNKEFYLLDITATDPIYEEANFEANHLGRLYRKAYGLEGKFQSKQVYKKGPFYIVNLILLCE